MKRKRARKGSGVTRDRGHSLLSLAGLAVVMLAVAGCDGGGGSSVLTRANVGISEFAGVIPKNHEVFCGDPVIEELTAGQTIDVGSIVISNDENYLYVEFIADDPWVMQSTHVHIGQSATDFPAAGNGQPIPGQFTYKHERADGDYVSVDEFAIPFTDLAWFTECGQSLYIFAHAEMRKLDDGGNVIDEQTGFGGDTPGDTGPRWYFYALYTTQCCDDDEGDDGEFRTQTQGGWGTICHGENPGCYRDEWFDVAFPDGIELGCDIGFSAIFTSSEAVQNFLPTGGKSGPLTSDLVDPTGNTSAGVLLGQLLAAVLSVGFDMVDPDFSESGDLLIDLVLCNTGTAADGLTVGQIIEEAKLIVGGCGGTTGLSAAAISDALAAINENFVDGDIDLGHLCAP